MLENASPSPEQTNDEIATVLIEIKIKLNVKSPQIFIPLKSTKSAPLAASPMQEEIKHEINKKK